MCIQKNGFTFKSVHVTTKTTEMETIDKSIIDYWCLIITRVAVSLFGDQSLKLPIFYWQKSIIDRKLWRVSHYWRLGQKKKLDWRDVINCKIISAACMGLFQAIVTAPYQYQNERIFQMNRFTAPIIHTQLPDKAILARNMKKIMCLDL